MKILYYLSSYPSIAGIPTVTELIADELLKRGHKVDIVAGTSSLEGTTIHHKHFRNFILPEPEKFDSKEKRERFQEILTNENYDIAIFQDSYASNHQMVVECIKDADVPLVVCEHNTPDFVLKKRSIKPIFTKLGFLRRLLHPYLLYRDRRRKKYLFEHSDRYILLSENFRTEFNLVTGVNPHHPKLAAIPNPCFIPEETPGKKEKLALFVGRLVPEKRVDRLINIWKEVEKDLPGWKFLIIGDGPEKRKLEKLRENIGAKNIEFLSTRKPDEYYRRASIVLLASQMEGWGMVLTEGMANGCVPIVLNSFSSLQDIVTDGKEGRIVSSHSLPLWREAIMSVCSKSENFEQMSQNAFAKVQDFDVSKVTDMWEKLMADVITKSKTDSHDQSPTRK